MATPKSFFMFCFSDFETKLSIPTAFVKLHRLHRLSLQLKIKPGRSWAVEIKNIDGVYYMADGWSKFVKDNDILEMKLVVFHIAGDSTLHVSIFGHDSFLELPPSSSVGGQGRSVVLVDDRRRPRFNFVLTKGRKYRMLVHHDFAEAAGLKGKMEVVLQYPPRQRRWAVELKRGRLRRHYTLELRKGWADFRVANGLVLGRTYSFEFDSAENVIFVNEIK